MATTLQLKRGTKDKLPSYAMEGEPLIALDTQELFIGDSNGKPQKISDIVVSDTEPLNKLKFWWDTIAEELKRFNGTDWIAVSSKILSDLIINVNNKVDKNSICINVKDYGAKADGVTDDSDVIQHVLDTYGRAYFPAGIYYLDKPLKITGQTFLEGETTSWLSDNSTRCTTFKPKTVAITIKDDYVTTQLQNITIQKICFIGGTNVIDIPLCHELTIKNCVFQDFGGCGIVLVRGERITLEDLQFYNIHGATSTAKLISLANLSDSISSNAFINFDFGVPGQWVDRISIKRINGISLNTNRIQRGIHCAGTLSNCTMSNIIFMGLRDIPLDINNLNASNINTIGFDACGSDTNYIPYGVHFNIITQSTISDVSPAYSGNCKFTTDFYIGYPAKAIIQNCFANGDNATTYGFYLGQNVGRNISFIGCMGTYYDQNTNDLIQSQVNMIGCGFTLSNVKSATGVNTAGDKAIIFNYMNDSNGMVASNVDFRLRRSSGGGQYQDILQITQQFAYYLGVKLYVGNGSPEGVVTAPQGSIYLRKDGGAGTTLYVKESGAYNTNVGWIASEQLQNQINTILTNRMPIYQNLMWVTANSSNVQVGDVFQTLGFYSKDDGGAGQYKILALSGNENWVQVNNTFYLSNNGEIKINANLKAQLILNGDVNIKQFGAQGNDSTNNTIIFSQVIKYITSNSLSLFIPSGIYRIAGEILVPSTSAWKIYGSNANSTIITQTTDNVSILHLSNAPAQAHSIQLAGITFRYLNNQPTTNTNATPLLFDTSPYESTFEDLVFNGGSYGIYVSDNTPNPWGCIFDNLRFGGSLSIGAIRMSTKNAVPNNKFGRIMCDCANMIGPVMLLKGYNFVIDTIEFLQSKLGCQLMSFQAASKVEIGSVKLENGIYNSGSVNLFEFGPNSKIHIGHVSIGGDTLTITPTTGQAVYVFASTGGTPLSNMTIGNMDLFSNGSIATNQAFAFKEMGNTTITTMSLSNGWILSNMGSSSVCERLMITDYQNNHLGGNTGDADYTVMLGDPNTFTYETPLTAPRVCILPSDNNLFNGLKYTVIINSGIVDNTNNITFKSGNRTICTISSNDGCIIQFIWRRNAVHAYDGWIVEDICTPLQNKINVINNKINSIQSIYISVKDFGAIGDGNADDTSYFIKALNSVKTLFIPAGTYKINGVLQLSNIKIYGEGKSNTVLNCPLLIGSNTTIENLQFGNSTKESTCVNNSTNITFNNCYITGGTDSITSGAIYVNDMSVSNIYFNNCEIANSLSTGISLVDKGTLDKHIENIYVNNCYFHDNKRSNFGCITRQDGTNPIVSGYKNIQLINSKFITSVDTPLNEYNINVSFDSCELPDKNPAGKIIVDKCTFTNGWYAFENAGATDMTFTNNNVNSTSTSTNLLFSMSKLNHKYCNAVISGNIFTSPTAGINLMGNNIKFNQNIINTGLETTLLNAEKSYIVENTITTNNYCISVNQSNNSIISNNVLDNSSGDATKNVVLIYGSATTNVIITNNSINTNGGFIQKQSSTINPVVNNNIDSFGNTITPIYTTIEKSSYSSSVQALTTRTFTITNNLTNKQSELIVEGTWSSRNNNTPMGGYFIISFCTYDQYSAMPKITCLGDTVNVSVDASSGKAIYSFSTAGNSRMYVNLKMICANQSDWTLNGGI